MKNKISLVWRLAFALIFVLSLGLTGAMPAAANEGYVIASGVEITSPTNESPAYTSPGHIVEINFDVTSDNLTDGATEGDAIIQIIEPTDDLIIKEVGPVTLEFDNGTHSYNYEVAIPIGTAEGSYDVLVKARQPAGDEEAAWIEDTQVASIIIDSTKPVITVVNPLDGALIKETEPDVDITASVTDTGAGIDWDSVEMTINSDVAIPVRDQDNLTFTIEDMPEGQYTVVLDVADLAGNDATQASWSFWVDNVAPVITITAPTAAQWFAAAAVNIAATIVTAPGTALDNATVALTLDGSSVTPTITLPADYAVTYAATGLADGEHNATLDASDTAGNAGTRDNVTFYVDTTRPTVTIDETGTKDSTNRFWAGPDELTGTSDDSNGDVDVSGVAKVELQVYFTNPTTGATLYWTGSAWSDDNTTKFLADDGTDYLDWKYEVPAGMLISGTHYYVVAIATDKVGLTSSPNATFDFYYDNDDPKVTFDGNTVLGITDYDRNECYVINTAPESFSGYVSDSQTDRAFSGVKQVDVKIIYNAWNGDVHEGESTDNHGHRQDNYVWDGYAWVVFDAHDDDTWVKATVDSDTLYTITNDKSVFKDNQTHSYYAWTLDDLPLLTSGRYYMVIVRATDIADNVGYDWDNNYDNDLDDNDYNGNQDYVPNDIADDEWTVDFVYDTVAPAVLIIEPVEFAGPEEQWWNNDAGTYYFWGQASYTSTVKVSLSKDVTVEGEGATVTYYWNGAAWVTSETWVDADKNEFDNDWEYGILYADNLTNGQEYTLRAQAFDMAGNTSTLDEDGTITTFVWDEEAPVISSIDGIGTLQANGQYYAGKINEISVTATDALSGVCCVNVTIDDRIIENENGQDRHNPQKTFEAFWNPETETYVADVENYTFVTGYTYYIWADSDDNVYNYGATPEVDGEWDNSLLKVVVFDAQPDVRILYPLRSEQDITVGDGYQEPLFDVHYLKDTGEISGVSRDVEPGAVVAVSVQIKDNTTGLYWNGVDNWTAVETWLAAAGDPSWSEVVWSANADDTADSTYAMHEWMLEDTDNITYIDGNYYIISAESKDNIGQYSDVEQISFIWDVSSPSLTVDGGLVESTNVCDDFWGTATDSGAGINEVVAIFLPTDWIDLVGTPEQGFGPVAYAHQSEPDENGMVNWYIHGEDYADILAQYAYYYDVTDFTVIFAAVDSSWDVDWDYDESEGDAENTVGFGNYCYETDSFSYSASDAVLYLENGWNFISTPYKLASEGNTFNEILAAGENAEFVTDIYGYDAETGWDANSSDSAVSIDQLSGYWVYVSTGYAPAGIALGYNYNESNGQTIPATKVLKGNAWNTFGPTGAPILNMYEEGDQNAPTSVSIQLASVDGSWTYLLGWDASYQEYLEAIVAPGTSQLLLPGQGYWIFINDDEDETVAAITGN